MASEKIQIGNFSEKVYFIHFLQDIFIDVRNSLDFYYNLTQNLNPEDFLR